MARASRTRCVSCPDQIPDACGGSHAYSMVSSNALEEQTHATHRCRMAPCLELNTVSIGWEHVRRKTEARTLVGGHDDRLSSQR